MSEKCREKPFDLTPQETYILFRLDIYEHSLLFFLEKYLHLWVDPGRTT